MANLQKITLECTISGCFLPIYHNNNELQEKIYLDFSPRFLNKKSDFWQTVRRDSGTAYMPPAACLLRRQLLMLLFFYKNRKASKKKNCTSQNFVFIIIMQ